MQSVIFIKSLSFLGIDSDFYLSKANMIERDIDFSTKEGVGIFFEEIENKLFSILSVYGK
jgi:hypothetical protein